MRGACAIGWHLFRSNQLEYLGMVVSYVQPTVAFWRCAGVVTFHFVHCKFGYARFCALAHMATPIFVQYGYGYVRFCALLLH